MGFRRGAIDALGKVLHVAGAFRLLHRWALPDSASILAYHGLVDEPLPVPEPCYLSLTRFESQMEYLARNFEVVHLEEALQADPRRRLKPFACVTFDDGFASVHDLALPVLERLGIPATVYLVTDFIDSDESVWFARLHQAICETTALSLQMNGQRIPLANPTDRARFSAQVQRALRSVPRSSFGDALEEVLNQLGSSHSSLSRPWEAFRILTRDEIQRMGRGDLIRFGAHTATHQVLTKTTRDDARWEIESSVAAVARLVERPSRSFAYPYGGLDDFDLAAIEDVRRAGLDYAVTTIPGPTRACDDPYAIKRYSIAADEKLCQFAARAHHARCALREILGTGRARA